MCTAISWKDTDHYFGRNLDLEYSYQESVTVTPRNYPIVIRKANTLTSHYAMIGMATIAEDYPLYYEATNEMGLSMAGLNFPGLACYFPEKEGADNVAPYAFIPWILGQCATVDQAEVLLNRINLLDVSFSPAFPLSPLHWLLSDSCRSLTIETANGHFRVWDNPVGVLTNNPPFDYHLYNLRNYLNASPLPASNRFSPKAGLTPYSNGMGGIGLPGDYSSASRFVKAAFVTLNSLQHTTEEEAVSHFFHILASTAMPQGCVEIRPGQYEITRYSSCCNTNKGIYYYTTYFNSRITAVDMHRENLDSNSLISYPLRNCSDFFCQN